MVVLYHIGVGMSSLFSSFLSIGTKFFPRVFHTLWTNSWRLRWYNAWTLAWYASLFFLLFMVVLYHTDTPMSRRKVLFFTPFFWKTLGTNYVLCSRNHCQCVFILSIATEFRAMLKRLTLCLDGIIMMEGIGQVGWKECIVSWSGLLVLVFHSCRLG